MSSSVSSRSSESIASSIAAERGECRILLGEGCDCIKNPRGRCPINCLGEGRFAVYMPRDPFYQDLLPRDRLDPCPEFDGEKLIDRIGQVQSFEELDKFTQFFYKTRMVGEVTWGDQNKSLDVEHWIKISRICLEFIRDKRASLVAQGRVVQPAAALARSLVHARDDDPIVEHPFVAAAAAAPRPAKRSRAE